MVRHRSELLGARLGGPDVEAPVHLLRIRVDDLSVDSPGEGNGDPGLAGRGGAGDHGKGRTAHPPRIQWAQRGQGDGEDVGGGAS